MSSPIIKILLDILRNYSTPMTLKYPSTVEAGKKYSQIPEGLRGVPERSEDKCIGCRACYFVCSGRATSIYDNEDKRLVEIFLFRCTFCAHCQEACPEEAITMSKKFEVTASSRSDSAGFVRTNLEMLKCKNCGKPFLPKKFVKRANERLMEKINPLVKDVVAADFQKVADYCLDCRRARGVELDTHTKKHVWLEVG